MRYLLIPTDDSSDTIPVEIPDNIVVDKPVNNSTKGKHAKLDSVKKEKITKLKNKLLKKTKKNLKKKVQISRPYGEIYHRNI